MTIRDQLIAALTTAGHTQVPSATRRYVVFQHKGRPGVFFYVGKAGALRCGDTIARSIPVNNLKAMFLAETAGSSRC